MTSRQSESSASLAFSQTNYDRVTLQSVALTLHKANLNQPSNEKQSFPHTSEKKETMQSNHKHVPSFFDPKLVLPGEAAR